MASSKSTYAWVLAAAGVLLGGVVAPAPAQCEMDLSDWAEEGCGPVPWNIEYCGRSVRQGHHDAYSSLGGDFDAVVAYLLSLD